MRTSILPTFHIHLNMDETKQFCCFLGNAASESDSGSVPTCRMGGNSPNTNTISDFKITPQKAKYIVWRVSTNYLKHFHALQRHR
mmetsp:Transcript_10135/g.17933  ORF Transcript_10135/g.17933 Transcript_10135/m.17933 type:complete len:85 (-) Transcript_10135:421-675(-)